MFNLIALVVSTTIGIVGILIGVKIAKKSGSFREVILDVSLMGKSLIRDPQFSEIIYGFAVSKGDIIICILLFKISNYGKLSAKNAFIRLAFPLSLRPPSIEEGFGCRILGPYGKSDVKRKSFKHKGYRYIDYVIPEINPGERVEIEEGINITHACGRTPVKVDFISKDGIRGQATCKVRWRSLPIHVQLSATDVTVFESCFHVRSYQAQDKEELERKIMEDETQNLREKLSKMKIPKETILKAYAPGVSKKTTVIMPKLKKIPWPKQYSAIKRSVYIEEPEESKKWIVVPPTGWKGWPIKLSIENSLEKKQPEEKEK